MASKNMIKSSSFLWIKFPRPIDSLNFITKKKKKNNHNNTQSIAANQRNLTGQIKNSISKYECTAIFDFVI